MAKVYHSEIFGLRETKYDWLNKHNIKNVKWNKLEPNSEFYLFIPQDQRMQKSYQTFAKITDIFPVNSVGVVTARDALTIGWTENEIWKRVQNFARLDKELARQTYQLGKDARDWKVEFAQKDLKESGLRNNHLTQILYRPFDIRYTYYTGKSRGFHCMPRGDVMQHMLKDNTGLIMSRQLDKSGILPAFVTNSLIDAHSITSAVSISYLFPLYLYPETNKEDLFNEHESGEKKPNIKPELFEELNKQYSTSPSIPLLGKKREENGEVNVTPEEIFYYIYAVLYSNTYRTKYAEFLKIDFPRVPFTKDYKLFIQLGKLGHQLTDLHLLKSKELEKTISKFPKEGSNEIEKPRFDGNAAQRDNGKVWINEEQYFDGINQEIWQYQIGGYQVCEKWLKDRKNRKLSLDEIQTYCKIVTALSKTIKLQQEIDKIYEEVDK